MECMDEQERFKYGALLHDLGVLALNDDGLQGGDVIHDSLGVLGVQLQEEG